MPERVTIRAVNNALRDAGHHAELVRGKDCFYFRGDEPDRWFTSLVMTPVLGSMSIEQWVAEYEWMKLDNERAAR